MAQSTRHYVDHEGTTYRVELHANGRPLIAERWALRTTHGKPIKLEGQLGRALVKKALTQRAETAGETR